MSDGAPFQCGRCLSSLCLLALLCQNKACGKEKKLRNWKKTRLSSIYRPIKLSILASVMTPPRHCGNPRDITSTIFLSFTGDVAGNILPDFHVSVSSPSISCFFEIRTKCKISNPPRCCCALQASLFCCDWMMLRLNDLWESRGFAVSLEPRHIAALWGKACKETGTAAACRYEWSLSSLLLCWRIPALEGVFLCRALEN